MNRFADVTLSQFLDAVAGPSPTPGGGTVAAMAGALGAALLQMAARLPRTRTNSQAERTELDRAHEKLTAAREQLATLADRDSDAYDAVTHAYRQPKGTDEEREIRKTAIQRALKGATEVPLETVRVVASILDSARTVAASGNRAASSDIGVAIGLLDAARDGATMNVRVNLPGVADERFRQEVERELDGLSAACHAELAAARAALS